MLFPNMHLELNITKYHKYMLTYEKLYISIFYIFTGDIWSWSGQGRVSSDLYCYHHNLLNKYIFESQNVLLCHVDNNTSGLKKWKL